MKRLLSLGLCLVAVCAVQLTGCSSTVSPPEKTPKLSIPATVDFGMVRVGLVKDTSIRFTNNGTDVLSITAQALSAPQFILVDTSQRTMTIDAGASKDVIFRFAPMDSNSIDATNTISSNAGTMVMNLHGGGIALTRLLQIPATINVVDTRLGLCADGFLGAQTIDTVWFTNSGNDTLRLSSVTVQPSTFSISDYSRVTIPGARGFIRYGFCPTQLGTSTGTVTVASNATSDSIVNFILTANGIRYTPGAGSVFNMMLDSLDANLQPVKAFPSTRTVQATGVSYVGMSGLTQIGEEGGKTAYYRIENNGDVSYWSPGLPTGDTAHPFAATWWVLPFGSHATNVNLLPKSDTTFTNAQGKTIDMHATETANYMKDTVMMVQGKNLTVQRVDAIISVTYTVSGTVVQTLQEGLVLLFSPDIGYLAAQLQLVNVVAGTQNSVSRSAIFLQGYTLK